MVCSTSQHGVQHVEVHHVATYQRAALGLNAQVELRESRLAALGNVGEKDDHRRGPRLLRAFVTARARAGVFVFVLVCVCVCVCVRACVRARARLCITFFAEPRSQSVC